ncbi:MAG: DUF4399 domain-containing protein [Pseudomonadota bacterium]
MNTMRRVIAITIATIPMLTACDRPEPKAPAVVSDDAQPVASGLPQTAAPKGASIAFLEPIDGARVSNPVTIRFGATNVAIVPAGDNAPSSGHHHLIVNAALPPAGLPIPKNEQYIHFGGGQTQTELTLPPGEHQLTLVLGDHLHIPHVPMIKSDTITITVD